MDDFLINIESQLSKYNDNAPVMNELYDHMKMNERFYEEIGYDEAGVYEKSNEAMGDGVIIGQRLNELHKLNDKNERILFAFVIACNFVLSAIVGIPSDNNSFLRPFIVAVGLYILNQLFTVFSIKLKSDKTSIMLIACSLTIGWIYLIKLSYPVCNLLFLTNISDKYAIYEALGKVIGVLISLSIALPNVYNVFYCSRVKNLKNTRKQYYFTKKIIVLNIVLAVIVAIYSVPAYLVNQKINEIQIEKRQEYVDFIGYALENYGMEDIEKIVAYVENSDYDFKPNNNYEPYQISYEMLYQKGNWNLSYYTSDDWYSIKLCPVLSNCSMTYLYVPYSEEERLFNKYGVPESYITDGVAIGLDTSKLFYEMSKFNYSTINYDFKSENSKTCLSFEWYLTSSLYGVFGYDYYNFDFDDNGKCVGYHAVLD